MVILKCYYISRHPTFDLDISGAVILMLMPMFHAYAFMSQLLIISGGLTAVIMSKFEEELFLRSIQNYKVRKQYLSI
jgi:acyl-CoA synthetase (AMP-forming)/AMP-acid ligase II